jgi:protein phosphatase
VGDSRIYLIRKDSIQQLTNDHSLVMEQARALITQEAESRTVNIIIRALGWRRRWKRMTTWRGRRATSCCGPATA